MINETLLINLNNETDFKFSYCYDAIQNYCIQNGYEIIINNQNNIIMLLGIIILILMWFFPQYKKD